MNGGEDGLVLRSAGACQLSQMVAERVDHSVRRREFPSEPRDNGVLGYWLRHGWHLHRHGHRYHPLSHRSFLGRRYWPRRHHCFSDTTPEMPPWNAIPYSYTGMPPNGILHTSWSFNRPKYRWKYRNTKREKMGDESEGWFRLGWPSQTIYIWFWGCPYPWSPLDYVAPIGPTDVANGTEHLLGLEEWYSPLLSRNYSSTPCPHVHIFVKFFILRLELIKRAALSFQMGIF